MAATIELLDGGATVPFIARYRKEATGGLDDTQLRTLDERLTYLREMEERRTAILKSIEEQGKLTPELERRSTAADTKARLEDLYLPFKPKRRTKAQIAREAGLEPLADRCSPTRTRIPETEAAAFRRCREGCRRCEGGARGARADPDGAFRRRCRPGRRVCATMSGETASWRSTLVEGKAEAGAKFSDYFDAAEAIAKLPSHRALAMLRGRNEEVLSLAIVPDEAGGRQSRSTGERMIAARFGIADRSRPADAWLQEVVRWTWRVKLKLHIEVELMTRLRERAEKKRCGSSPPT